jgi:hypothetical protein
MLLYLHQQRRGHIIEAARVAVDALQRQKNGEFKPARAAGDLSSQTEGCASRPGNRNLKNVQTCRHGAQAYLHILQTLQIADSSGLTAGDTAHRGYVQMASGQWINVAVGSWGVANKVDFGWSCCFWLTSSRGNRDKRQRPVAPHLASDLLPCPACVPVGHFSLCSDT